jgi:hypothetical protein
VPRLVVTPVPREPIDFGGAGSLRPDDAVIALAVTVHIDAVGKTLHEPHLRFR